jgi:hypothetical protein
MNTLAQDYLAALGIRRWELKHTANSEVMIIIDDEQALSTNAQRLLKAMLASVGIQQYQVSNADAIALAQPRLLICLGNKAAQQLLKGELEFLRGKRHCYGDNQIPVVVTYHPEELLQQPSNKKKAYLDLQLLSFSYT